MSRAIDSQRSNILNLAKNLFPIESLLMMSVARSGTLQGASICVDMPVESKFAQFWNHFRSKVKTFMQPRKQCFVENIHVFKLRELQIGENKKISRYDIQIGGTDCSLMAYRLVFLRKKNIQNRNTYSVEVCIYSNA